MKVAVASKNPVKIEAVRLGFAQMFPALDRFEVFGRGVESGVSAQPMGNDETLAGALNRVERLMHGLPDADYWVGIEGGVEDDALGLAAFAWVVIRSGEKTGYGKTATFFLPPRVADLVRQGKELGEADDLVFGRMNSKQEDGAVGLLTQNVIDRTRLYQPAVVLALIPFCNSQLYFS